MTMIKKLIRRGKPTRDYYVVFGVKMPDGTRKKIELTTNMKTRKYALEVGRLKEALWRAENSTIAVPIMSGLTLNALREWDLNNRKGTSDYLGHKTYWNAILRTHDGNRPLTSFEPASFFDEHIEVRAAVVAPQSWRRETAKLKKIVKEAIRRCVREGDTDSAEQLRSLLDFYPENIKSTKSTSPLRGKIHSPVILERFFAVLPQQWRNCYRFARNTGIRSAELRRMTYDMIKLSTDGTWIAVLPEHVTKTKEGRDVPLNKIAVETLQSQRDLDPLGSHIWQDWDQATIQKAVMDIGYTDADGKPCMIYLRDMRHEFATNASYKSGDHKAVRDMLGHRSLKMTERYLHSDLARKKAVTQVLEDQSALESHISIDGNHELPLTNNLFKSKEITDTSKDEPKK